MSTKIADSTGKGLLDRDIFYYRATYNQELEQVFGRSWLFIGHESQISSPNDFATNCMGAPIEVKNAQRPNLTRGFGPSGATEQDDMSNWIQCTSSSKGL